MLNHLAGMRNIFIAATGQHVGKTTATLGLVANFRQRGFKTGYCKPMGQKYVETLPGEVADKDAVLFAETLGFEMVPHIHSPVIILPGVTRRYITDPSAFDFKSRIAYAAKYLEANFDLVVYEGTGHPGVGSVVDLSNARVAKMLGSGVLMIVEGGIGSTIDRMNMSLALFREEGVPILGVVVNKVREDKFEDIKFHLEKRFKDMGVPLLGVLPYDPTLSFPIMEAVNYAVEGKVILNEHRLSNKIEEIIAGSLIDTEVFNSFQNLLLVVSYRRLDEAMQKIQAISKDLKLDKPMLSGVIVTGDGRRAHWYEMADLRKPYFIEHEIPVIATTLDTYGSVVKVSRIEVKINNRTPWKVERAIELINQNVDVDDLIRRLDLRKK
jgi:BioD-like phosphotransacetylase family protein